MCAVVEHGAPLVDDPARLGGVTALGVDATAYLAATSTNDTQLVTGLVDLTRAAGPARLLRARLKIVSPQPSTLIDEEPLLLPVGGRCGLGRAIF